MGLYFVLICSICVLSNINGIKCVQEADESILEKVIRGDEGEGTNLRDFATVQCEPPIPPENGHYVGPISLDTGSIVHVKCNQSYHLLGADFIQCQAVPSPFRHIALWFHEVGTTSYSSIPECIKEISKNDVRKELKDGLNKIIDQKFDPDDSEVIPPGPLESMGGPQKAKDVRVYLPTEEEHAKSFKDNSEPIKNQNCDDRPFTGLCRASIPRYYFDTKSKSCKTFIYGGCGGNGNNYLTIADCEKMCKNEVNSNNSES